MTSPDVPAGSRHIWENTLGLQVSTAELLYLLAVNISEQSTHSQAEVWRRELLRLIGQCLRDKDDDTLWQALHMARTAATPDACQYLRLVIEATVQMASVQIGSRAEPRIGRLFAIPVVLLSPQGLTSPRVPDSALFLQLQDSLRDPLLFGHGDVTLCNYLYHPAELAISWSEKHALLQELIDAGAGHAATSLEALHQRGMPADVIARESGIMSLRFMVGVFAYAEADVPPILVEDAKAPLLEPMQAWARRFSGQLEQAMSSTSPGTKFIVDGIHAFHQGWQQGFLEVKLATLCGQVLDKLDSVGVTPQEAKAHLALHAAEDNDDAMLVRITLAAKKDGHFLGGFDYLVSGFEEADDALVHVAALIADIDIVIDEFVTDMQPAPTDGFGRSVLPQEVEDDDIAAMVTSERRQFTVH